MAQVTTSHYKIYKYWRDKAITPKGEVINGKDSNNIEDIYVVDDDYVPRCWACGLPVVRDRHIDEFIKKTCKEDDEETNLKLLWDNKETKHKLNRCHIIPGALKGGR